MTNLQNNPTEGWRPVPAACFAQFVAHVRRASGQCAKPSLFKVSRTLHAAYLRIGPRYALPACNRFRPSDGPPPEYAVTAQIAHIKYAAQYARLVRIRVRTGSRIARRFALQVRTLLREPGANQAASLLSKVMVARRWFPLWFPGFFSGFHWQIG